jgi:hypothetical protein
MALDPYLEATETTALVIAKFSPVLFAALAMWVKAVDKQKITPAGRWLVAGLFTNALLVFFADALDKLKSSDAGAKAQYEQSRIVIKAIKEKDDKTVECELSWHGSTDVMQMPFFTKNQPLQGHAILKSKGNADLMFLAQKVERAEITDMATQTIVFREGPHPLRPLPSAEALDEAMLMLTFRGQLDLPAPLLAALRDREANMDAVRTNRDRIFKLEAGDSRLVIGPLKVTVNIEGVKAMSFAPIIIPELHFIAEGGKAIWMALAPFKLQKLKSELLPPADHTKERLRFEIVIFCAFAATMVNAAGATKAQLLMQRKVTPKRRSRSGKGVGL